MMRVAWLFPALLAIAGCDFGGKPADTGEAAGPAKPAATASASAVPGEPAALGLEVDTELYGFDYSYPVQVARIPELKQRLDSELEAAQARLAELATRAEADARERGPSLYAYAEGTAWEVVADTPRFLSLSAAIYSYTGGAHPNSGTRTLVWDREAKRALAPADFFLSPAALEAAVRDRYCAALDAERGKRREDDADMGIDEFAQCPPIGDLTILLGSSNRRKFNRIGLVADPYVAGPYAEGDYDITVPVTREVLEAVRPAYRDAFALR